MNRKRCTLEDGGIGQRVRAKYRVVASGLCVYARSVLILGKIWGRPVEKEKPRLCF